MRRGPCRPCPSAFASGARCTGRRLRPRGAARVGAAARCGYRRDRGRLHGDRRRGDGARAPLGRVAARSAAVDAVRARRRGLRAVSPRRARHDAAFLRTERPMNGDASIAPEVARRRTFAIISHPDAGKTTLTEKLLLYGGAISTAGQVAARRRQRGGHVGLDGARTRARHLDHLDGAAVPLSRLHDEPARHAGPPGLRRGHVPHAARGRQRRDADRRRQRRRAADEKAVRDLPRAAHPAVHVHQQDGPPERATRSNCSTNSRACSGIGAFPINWPIGNGPSFRGVFDRTSRQVHLFERTTTARSRRRSR